MRTRWSRLEEATAGGEQGAEPVGGGGSDWETKEQVDRQSERPRTWRLVDGRSQL